MRYGACHTVRIALYMFTRVLQVNMCFLHVQTRQTNLSLFKSGPTAQVARSAAHMSVRTSKLLDVKDKCMLV